MTNKEFAEKLALAIGQDNVETIDDPTLISLFHRVARLEEQMSLLVGYIAQKETDDRT